jgi:hypothetical protein
VHENDFFENYIVFLLKLDLDGGAFTTYNENLLFSVFLFKYEPSLCYWRFNLVDTL